MNNDLISREALKKALKSNCDLCHDKNTNWCEHCCPLNDFEDLIDNAPTVEERPQDEMIETKHRLNLLIGVLYSNQLISENDLEYIEDSIKELMKGGAE